MTTPNTGGPAFPVPHNYIDRFGEGMTLRDYFAAKAMQQLMQERGERPIRMVTDFAYDWADEMMRAREA